MKLLIRKKIEAVAHTLDMLDSGTRVRRAVDLQI